MYSDFCSKLQVPYDSGLYIQCIQSICTVHTRSLRKSNVHTLDNPAPYCKAFVHLTQTNAQWIILLLSSVCLHLVLCIMATLRLEFLSIYHSIKPEIYDNFSKTLKQVMNF